MCKLMLVGVVSGGHVAFIVRDFGYGEFQQSFLSVYILQQVFFSWFLFLKSSIDIC